MDVAKEHNWTPNRYRHGWIPLASGGNAGWGNIPDLPDPVAKPSTAKDTYRHAADVPIPSASAPSVDGLPADVYTNPGKYMESRFNPLIGTAAYAESLAAIRAMRGKPNATITVYRGGVPAGRGINSGDWVTLSRRYAEAIQRIRGGEIVKARVPAKTVHWNGRDLNEFAYHSAQLAAMVAKQTVSTGSSTGQTVTLNMNTTRLRAYRKLRRQGLPHRQALAMAKRVRMAKQAPYTAHHPPIIHHGKPNWVVREGGMPGPIDAIARALISQGWSESRAEATAVSQAKKECATGRAFGGKVPLHPASRAVICAAVARWEAMKAAA